MTEPFLRAAIMEVLPDLPESSKDILEETLRMLEVATADDFKFVREDDLLSALRPIEARKVVATWKLKCQVQVRSASPLPASPGSSTSASSVSPSVSTSSFNSCHSPGVDWVDTFQIPWEKFPQELTQCLEQEKRPSPRLRREMVRIVVQEMMKEKQSVCKKNTVDIAKRMVAKYPKSLQDVIEGDVIGTGYHSLVKQLQNRIENAKRPTTPKIRKRKHSHDSGTKEIPPEERAAIQDAYGCKWELKFLPLTETSESQEEKKQKLKSLSLQHDQNLAVLTSLMKATYYTQRKEVNKGKEIKSIREEWPYWFQESGMNVHFQELTGISLKETFLKNVDQKEKRLLNYFKTVAVNKNRKFCQAVAKLGLMRGEHAGSSEDVIEMVLPLLAYFDEKEDVMLCNVEDTCLAGEVPMDQVPLTPTIVVCGQSCFSSRRMMLSVDRVIVNDNISSFIASLCMMFGSYYCFNIYYPTLLASTLEFLQRCFFSINQEKGTKVEKMSTARLNVNPRVLTLIQDLSDHEWRDL